MYVSNYYAKTMAELLKNVQPLRAPDAVVHVNLSFACNYCRGTTESSITGYLIKREAPKFLCTDSQVLELNMQLVIYSGLHLHAPFLVSFWMAWCLPWHLDDGSSWIVMFTAGALVASPISNHCAFFPWWLSRLQTKKRKNYMLDTRL